MEKCGLWAKHMGLKPGAIRNTRGEHSGNILETWWEPTGNLRGTVWEQRKNWNFFLIKKPKNFCKKIVMKKMWPHLEFFLQKLKLEAVCCHFSFFFVDRFCYKKWSKIKGKSISWGCSPPLASCLLPHKNWKKKKKTGPWSHLVNTHQNIEKPNKIPNWVWFLRVGCSQRSAKNGRPEDGLFPWVP